MKKKVDTQFVMLVDGENLLHRSFHKFERLRTHDGKYTGAIFGFFKSLHYLLTRFRPDTVLVTFDNGHSIIRVNELPNYKGHRKNISIDYESLQHQKKVIMNILKCLRIPYIFDKKHKTQYEGDDFLAYFATNAEEEGHKVLIVSSDKDFNQLISKNVTIFNPNKDERVNLRNCKEIFGYEASETVDYLSLVGDSSDDIPGFKGIGPVKARQLLDKYGSIEDALAAGYWKDAQEAKTLWERNKLLINLRYFLERVPLSIDEIPVIQKTTPMNLKRYLSYCLEYSLNSMKTEMFIEPFKKLIR